MSSTVGAEPMWIELARLVPHPSNPNVLAPEYQEKLARHIAETGLYPYLIVRPLPDGTYQLLDGHWRAEVLRQLGELGAWCQIWPVDDEQALVLLATLNRLAGDDVEGRRTALIAELAAYRPLEELARLLPETQAQLEASVAAASVDIETLLRSLTARVEEEINAGPRVLSFAVPVDAVAAVEAAVEAAMAGLAGRNRRGRALVEIAAAFLAERTER